MSWGLFSRKQVWFENQGPTLSKNIFHALTNGRSIGCSRKGRQVSAAKMTFELIAHPNQESQKPGKLMSPDEESRLIDPLRLEG